VNRNPKNDRWVTPGLAIPLTGFGGRDKALPVKLDPKQGVLFKELIKAAVCIRMSAGNTGAGVVLSQQGLVLTAWHVLKRNGRPYVHRFRLNRKRGLLIINKTGERADLVYADERADVAVIRMRQPPRHLQAAELGNSDIEPGTALYRVGVDDGTPLAAGYLIKHSYHQRLKQMELSLPARYGASGGPVFNDRGQVVGIVLRALFDDLHASCCDAIPINLVRQRLLWRKAIKELLDDE
jgi:S1-C subfamily serine protease